MCPSTEATWFEAATSVDWVTVRDVATMLNPRATNAFTMPAPIPWEAPVTMAVLRWPLTGVHLRFVNGEGIAWEPETLRGFARPVVRRPLYPRRRGGIYDVLFAALVASRWLLRCLASPRGCCGL